MADFEKPSNTEDEFFAREDIEKLRRLAMKHADKMEAAEREQLKALHHMHCPSCGMPLQPLKHGKVEVDACFNCGGIFLDKGELEELVQQRESVHPVMDAILSWVRRPSS